MLWCRGGPGGWGLVDAQLALLDYWHLGTPNKNQRLYYLFMALYLFTLFLRTGYAGRGPGGLVCSNRCIRNVSAGTHNMKAVDDTSEAVDVDGGLRATADEEKKYRP